MTGALRVALRGVSAYKNIMRNPLMKTLTGLLDALALNEGETALERYTDFFFSLHSAGHAGIGPWLHDMLRYEDAPYPAAAERGGCDPALETAARRDIETFLLLAQLDCDEILARIRAMLPDEYGPVLANLPRWSPGAPFSVDGVLAGYRANGTGIFARYRAFLWERGILTPVPDPDCTGQEFLLGYERQRSQVIANTRALCEGRAVNNVLLYGDSGTGKSVTVKSLLAVPGLENLRLIELEKDALADMPDLIRTLIPRRQKFVLFIDDLAFDQDDRTYSMLKTMLEGGLERRPGNVAIYATSNRRNLVRQNFSDRLGDEVDTSETIHEKTSLADRFGVRIPYLALNKREFLAMVERMARLYHVDTERDALHEAALKWELHHPGRTPRTARQFITSLSV